MKSFLIRILIFVLLLIPFYCGLLIAWPKFLPKFFQDNLPYKGSVGYLDRRLQDLETNYISNADSLDILFIGSSRSYRHYDPRIFEDNGLKVFNLGSSSQTLVQAEIFAKKYIPLLRPKLVIFDIYPNSLANDGVESSLDLISNSNKPVDYFYLLVHHRNMKIFNTFLYSEMLSLTGTSSIKPLRNIDTYVKGGFVERKLIYAKPTTASYSYSFREEQIAALNRMTQFLKKNNVSSIFVISPMSSGIQMTGPSIEKLIEKKSFEFYNFKSLEVLDDSLNFYNSSHLNQTGAEKYSRFLIDSIIQ